MKKPATCPLCNEPTLKATHSRVVAGYVERRRRCECGYADLALYEPERLLSAKPLVRCNTTATPTTEAHPVG